MKETIEQILLEAEKQILEAEKLFISCEAEIKEIKEIKEAIKAIEEAPIPVPMNFFGWGNREDY